MNSSWNLHCQVPRSTQLCSAPNVFRMTYVVNTWQLNIYLGTNINLYWNETEIPLFFSGGRFNKVVCIVDYKTTKWQNRYELSRYKLLPYSMKALEVISIREKLNNISRSLNVNCNEGFNKWDLIKAPIHLRFALAQLSAFICKRAGGAYSRDIWQGSRRLTSPSSYPVLRRCSSFGVHYPSPRPAGFSAKAIYKFETARGKWLRG